MKVQNLIFGKEEGMAQFRVKVKDIETFAEDFNSYNNDLNRIAVEIEHISSAVSVSSLLNPIIKKSLRSVSANIKTSARNTNSLGNGLKACAVQYRQTENQLMNGGSSSINDIRNKIREIIRQWSNSYGGGDGGAGGHGGRGTGWGNNIPGHHGGGGYSWPDRIHRGGGISRLVLTDMTNRISPAVVYMGSKYSDEVSLVSKTKLSKKIDSDKNAIWSDKDTTYYDRDGNVVELTEAEKKSGKGGYKKKNTLYEIGAERKLEGSLLNYSAKKDGSEVEADFGKAEAHSSITGGLYTYDKDGKQVLAPGVEAEIGTSVCLATSKAKKTIGNDKVSATGEVNATVGRAEAKAGSSLGFVDGKVQANANVKAEVIAGEVKASGSVSVVGVEGKVTGSVNFGIGAHADVGYRDGVIKCDLGVSLGFGGSVSFELDTTGLVKSVTGKSKALWEKGSKYLNKFKK